MYQVYKCNDCGAEFTDPHNENYYEYHDELDTGNRLEAKTIERCPECYSDNIEGGYWCETCGDRYAEGTLGGAYCEDCLKKVDKAVEGLQKALKTDWKTAVGLVVQWSENNW